MTKLVTSSFCQVLPTSIFYKDLFNNSWYACVQVCMCSSVWRNPLEINLYVWFYFIVFVTILYNTWETGHIESYILLSLSASCLLGYWTVPSL